MKIPVRITDINYGNHVGNDSLVSIIHEARMQFLQHHGYTELNIEGIGLIISALIVEYKNESFYKDVIELKIGCTDITKVSFDLLYKLSVLRNDKEIIIANAQTTMVCYNYKLKKVSASPEKLINILQI
jgi:YbgC/YbaW family acyl-CoA thioester hydrolase